MLSPLDSIVLPVGTVLGGQYAVEGVLGKPGGFGITYLARDTRLETHVAVKEFFPRSLARRGPDGCAIRPNTPDDADPLAHARQRFLDEARLLARFHHPAIVRVRSFFEQHGTAYLVMDYLDGLPLSVVLERRGGRLPVETALAVARPVLAALREIHAAGVLHRDVDPHNVYLTRRNEVVLLDFGAARQAVAEAEGGRSLSVVLKPGYAPYEQYATRGQGPWTDLYAVAALLYRMIAGVPVQEATGRIVEDEVVPLGDLVRQTYGEAVPERVARAVMWGLAVRPADRPATVDAFEDALFGEADAPEPAATVAYGAASAQGPAPLPPAPPVTPPARPDYAVGPGTGPAAAPVLAAAPAAYPAPAAAPAVAATEAYDDDDAPRGGFVVPLLLFLLLILGAGGAFYLLTRPDATPRTPTTQLPAGDADAGVGTPADPSPAGDPSAPDPTVIDPTPVEPAPPEPLPVAETPPLPTEQVPPEYPAAAADAGLEGRVRVRVTVGTDGTVTDAEVEESTDPVFDEAALEAAKRWRFEPATQGGEPVEATVTIPFTFKLDGE